MKRIKQKNQKGFTLVELMIASGVFSLILLVFLLSFVHISQIYYKGTNTTRTHETARRLVEAVSDDIRFSQKGPTNPIGYGASGDQYYFCVGASRYRYKLYNHLGDNAYDKNTNFGVIREGVSGGCYSPDVRAGNNPEELLSDTMQLNSFSVGPCTSGRCTVEAFIVFYNGDRRVFNSEAFECSDLTSSTCNAWKAPDAVCTGEAISSQFCGTARFRTTLLERF